MHYLYSMAADPAGSYAGCCSPSPDIGPNVRIFYDDITKACCGRSDVHAQVRYVQLPTADVAYVCTLVSFLF